MSRPIYEPNIQRTAARLNYGQEQLFRRPAPTALGRWPWVGLQNPGTTLASSAALSPSLMTDLYWDPTLVALDPTDPTAGFDSIFGIQKPSSGGTDYWAVTNRVEGWFLIEMVHTIEDGTGGGAGKYFLQKLVFDAATFAFPDDRSVGFLTPWGSANDTIPEIQPFIETVRILWLPGEGVQMQPKLAQNTGVSKGVEGHFKIFYLGGVGGGTDSADWEFKAA